MKKRLIIDYEEYMLELQAIREVAFAEGEENMLSLLANRDRSLLSDKRWNRHDHTWIKRILDLIEGYYESDDEDDDDKD